MSDLKKVKAFRGLHSSQRGIAGGPTPPPEIVYIHLKATEREERCISAGVCPSCGQHIRQVANHEHVDLVCLTCRTTWAYVEKDDAEETGRTRSMASGA